MSPWSRGTICPSFARTLPSRKLRARGTPGAVAPAVSCAANAQKNAHELSAGTTEHIRHSPRDVGRLIPCSPRRTGLYSHRRPQFLASLTPASGCRDHTALSNASTRFVLARQRRPSLPASRVVTIGRTSLMPRRDGRQCGADAGVSAIPKWCDQMARRAICAWRICADCPSCRAKRSVPTILPSAWRDGAHGARAPFAHPHMRPFESRVAPEGSGLIFGVRRRGGARSHA
jgi:hypothetical protein